MTQERTFSPDGTEPYIFDNTDLASEEYYGFVFNQYNSIGSRFHWWQPPQELLETMPPKRQSLFRHAYGEGANTGLDTRNLFERPIG